MAFWGVEVRPGKPYTHSFENDRGRLRISQATMAIGPSTTKSFVQCNVGDKSPVLLCVLLPDKNESQQLDLEFDEAESVTFSVIGPRGVYLTGYYVGNNRRSNMQDDTESYGEDIAYSDTQESNHQSGEDEYEDSFINDDEPDPLTPSPVSSSRDGDDGGDLKKKRNGKAGRKRLKKKYQSVESDDEMSVQEVDDEDFFPISSICKNKTSEASRKKDNKETTAELEEKIKDNDDKCKSEAGDFPPDSEDKDDVQLLDDETKGGSNPMHDALLPSVQDGPANEVKTKKKKKEHSKKGNATKVDDENNVNVRKDKKQQAKTEAASMDHDVIDTKDVRKPDDTGIDCSMEVLPSAEVSPGKKSKTKRKRKEKTEVNNDGTDKDQLSGNKHDDQQKYDNSSGIDSKQVAKGNLSEEKKVKKKRRKTNKTQELDENTNVEVKEDSKPSAIEPESNNMNFKSSKKKTLSNGLIVEDLVTGKSKGRAATSGRKVKVQYVVKLKNGQVIDSDIEKSPHKFRLGDKEVIEGLNVGLDGMRAGDRRRLVIPPSMRSGYQGTGENIPPNSWLVYEVEMLSVH